MPLILWSIAHLITAAVIGFVIGPVLRNFLIEAGAVKQNYRQKEVANMMGFLIVIVWILLMAIASVFSSILDAFGMRLPEGFQLTPGLAMPLTILITGVGLFGLIDDLMGSRDSTGFRGHIGQLLQGRLTTGALKAIGIPLVSFYAVYQLSGSFLEALGNGLLVALFVNTLNLLDLRPGRALKLYIPLQALFILYSPVSYGLAAASLLGVALVLIRSDLKEEIMLGDVGSNILGAVLGFSFALSFGWPVKIVLIIILIGLQVLTEKYSLTAIIEQTPVLKRIDRMGRP